MAPLPSRGRSQMPTGNLPAGAIFLGFIGCLLGTNLYKMNDIDSIDDSMVVKFCAQWKMRILEGIEIEKLTEQFQLDPVGLVFHGG